MLSEEVAQACYQILVEEAGAPDTANSRDDFLFTVTDPAHDFREYRFMGCLGFGGKFRTTTFSVDCYREDENPTRLEIIARTNARLAQFREQA